MKKYSFIFIVTLILIIVVIKVFDSKTSFSMNNFSAISSYNDLDDLVLKQGIVDKELIKLSQNKNYTFKNPAVIKNPYGVSPLSAVLVFKTNNFSIITVIINEEYSYKLEKAKEHILPIYGLKDGSINKIELKSDDGKTNVLYITTENNNYQKLKIKKTYSFPYGILMTSINTFSSDIYDYEGNVIWHFNSNSYLDTIKLKNGNLLSVFTTNDITSLVEIDFLGKIYNIYKIHNNLHHTFYEFDKYYIVLTYSEDNFRRNDLIYLINKETGKIDYKMDLLNIIKYYSEKMYKNLLTSEDWAHVNSAFLKDDELLLSLRKSNSIISVNINTKKINYIINTTNYWDKNFEKLIITGKENILSQHTVFIDSNGNVGMFNNNVSRINHLIDSVEVYQNKVNSYPLLINIENKKIKNVWKYVKEDELLFSPAYSSFEILNNSNKLINYSCLIDKRNGKYYYEDQYMKIIELDNNDNIIFEATKEKDSVVAVYKINIFEDVTNLNLKNKIKTFEVE